MYIICITYYGYISRTFRLESNIYDFVSGNLMCITLNTFSSFILKRKPKINQHKKLVFLQFKIKDFYILNTRFV